MKNNVLRAAPYILCMDSTQASLLLKIANNATKYKNGRNSSRRGGQGKMIHCNQDSIPFALPNPKPFSFLTLSNEQGKISGLGIQNTLINAIEEM